jgi:autotransporter translocation and assembly factor TamB
MLGSGPVRVEGVCCDDERFRLTIEGDRNRLRHAVGLDVVASSRLALDFTRESLTVRGDVDVHEGLLEHNALPDGGVPISRDVIRVDTPDGPVRRFMLVADLGTHIEPGFTLRTSMLEATLGGDLRLQRRADDSTSLFGDLQVLGGELRAYGQTLRLGDGSVGFLGDPLNPDLNLSAEREIRGENLRVGFRVRGSLDEPELVLFSDPQLPERETLSYLVRGRGPDAGASVDGTAMALSLGASALNRSGVLAPLESIPGLSDVSLSAEGSDDDVAATISAYVGRRLYLSYGVGLYEPISALTARLYLRSRLWLEVVSRLESSFDLYYRFDID